MNITSVEYKKIMDICETNECFYYVDCSIGDTFFRIFNYRIASYSDWCIDSITFELRGLMVEITQSGEFIRVASRTPIKFFNINENPFVMDLDLGGRGRVCDKLDGSIISTFTYYESGEQRLGLKSKGSLESVQAVEAYALLKSNPSFYDKLFDLAVKGFTTYCEYCSQTNRIVISYKNPNLTILGIRNDLTGQELTDTDFPELTKYWVDYSFVDNIEEFIPQISDMHGIEGYVITLPSNTRVKIKTTWYLALHHTKDSINSPRRLYEAVLEEATDDIKSLFYEDPLVIKLIEEMELFVETKYNHLVDTVERFYERNKELERKEYAILGQKELNRLEFGLAMQKYVGRSVNYKGFMKKKWKQFGIKDDPKTEE